MKLLYRGRRFPPEIISHGVWFYHRFTLSFRDVEDLLAERGIIVSYESIRSWCLIRVGFLNDLINLFAPLLLGTTTGCQKQRVEK